MTAIGHPSVSSFAHQTACAVPSGFSRPSGAFRPSGRRSSVWEAARLRADGLLERLVQLGADDEHHALEACAVSVVDRVIQNDLTVRTDGVDLLEAAVARAHTCRHNDQNRFIHMFSSFQSGVFVSSAAVLYFAQILLLYRKGG